MKLLKKLHIHLSECFAKAYLKAKKSFLSLLDFLQLLDRTKKLSITNIAVIVLITKIAIAPTIDWAVVAGLMLSLINYGHRRYESNKFEKIDTEIFTKIQQEIKNLTKKE